MAVWAGKADSWHGSAVQIQSFGKLRVQVVSALVDAGPTLTPPFDAKVLAAIHAPRTEDRGVEYSSQALQRCCTTRASR